MTVFDSMLQVWAHVRRKRNEMGFEYLFGMLEVHTAMFHPNVNVYPKPRLPATISMDQLEYDGWQLAGVGLLFDHDGLCFICACLRPRPSNHSKTSLSDIIRILI
jgi:hypothetical protein